MGLDFFKHAIALQKRYAKANQRIVNDLQTNGLLLDDAWYEFLKNKKMFWSAFPLTVQQNYTTKCEKSKTHARPCHASN